jgi:hypothetical protein
LPAAEGDHVTDQQPTPTGDIPRDDDFALDTDDAAAAVDDRDAPARDVESAPADSDVAPQYGVGPFTIRELAISGVWLIAFVVSFFSLSQLGFVSVWTRGIDWVLAIGVPTAAVFLLVLRRLSPTGIRRVGSLGIDQFASVAFSVAAVVWLGQVWFQISVAVNGGLWTTTWVLWVELFLMLVGVVLTVFAPLIPVFEEDFQGRTDVPAHRNAQPIRAVVARPRPQTVPVADAPVAAAGGLGSAHDSAAQPGDTAGGWAEPAATTEAVPQAHQAFWALAPEERDVLDENGIPIFRIGPAAWALVIEDRGGVYVVRHEDGRIGYLHDVSGVTRG